MSDIAGSGCRLLTLALPEGIRIAPRRAGMVAALLRKAVMSRVGDPLPPEISGHGAQDSPHVAYLPMLDAGRAGASGQVTGVGVLSPPGRADIAESIRDALLIDQPFTLDFRGTRLRFRFPAPAEISLESSTWCASARVWTTVTPIVLNRFPGRGKVAAELARTCVRMGLGEPAAITVDRDPLTEGGVALGPADLPRRERTPRPFSHATIEFPDPIEGPLILGAQRYLGMGLCLPVKQ
ncbi:type I-U CRISPR-associated protein Cas5/Cas6 [Saccharopolyspora sp. HNM0986]|uniref:type I-G CRISPR-associated protein Csb2 n=1 Tax=Saccharopolyspora galaxeae TaxID=2781241 RepID=UPI001909CD1F|nr:type I-U CRISPR-associated protein Csb2 [Saccharopolyspora sp. HNM0986]MBK0869637.1 type I-U CRISPR-associated protein Cas5/Cas6 [Saccharopolyspora sp. HNM0986]